MPAALVMASLHGLIRAKARAMESRVTDLVRSLNAFLYRESGHASYATLFYGVYDDGTGVLSYVNAGHTPPSVVRRANGGRDATSISLDATCLPVGLFERIDIAATRVQLSALDWVVICSDGVTEAMNETGDEFGQHGVIGLVRRHADLTASAMCDAVLAAMADHQGAAPPHDDVTILAGRVGGAAA